MIKKDKLEVLYKNGKSSSEIANFLNCSMGQVNYWLKKHNIPKRSISEAVYIKNNPQGDPFLFRGPENLEEAKLMGIGLGLYWGEGTKADTASVRLGNTDPMLIASFINFLTKFFGVKKKDFKFGLQIFNDISEKEAKKFWSRKIRIKNHQFYKTVISPSQSRGTYRRKAKYGVLTVYYHNKKLRDLLINMI